MAKKGLDQQIFRQFQNFPSVSIIVADCAAVRAGICAVSAFAVSVLENSPGKVKFQG